MPSKHEELLSAIRANTEGMARLQITLAATLEALAKHTDIRVQALEEGPEPELSITSERADMLIKKVYALFEAESTEGVMAYAVPVLIQEPRNVDEVQLVLSVLLGDGYLEERSGVLYKKHSKPERPGKFNA